MTTEALQEIHLRCQHVPLDESTVISYNANKRQEKIDVSHNVRLNVFVYKIE